MSQTIFDGNAKIYLQGLEALEPIFPSSLSYVKYFVVCNGSNIFVHDYRRVPNSFIIEPMQQDDDDDEFADIFNQVAHVKILATDDCSEIIISEIQDTLSIDEDMPTLWLGSLDEYEIPAYEFYWDFFIEIKENLIAFAALVE